ncbi:MAG: M16 family metallopeptidase, partial [Planctomycetota bacterium]
MKYPARILTLLFPALIFTNSIAAQGTELAYKKITLENGLDVIVHEDHSDPVVSVYVSYHVGSGREEPGRSGFAHLFEHMLFQGSQNVGDDQHFKLISEAGGTLNGTTNLDRTLYFETVPANQLELALWLEADRMGFVLPAVTLKKLDNQRDVVKNERRQNYENRPYAQSGVALVAALYPPDHPYSWVTIGSQEDLTAASLDDVHNFFRRWYGPNNATLAIGGDVKAEEVFVLVKKYFGTIPRGPEVTKPTPRPAPLEQTKRIVTEDKVQLPQIVLAWPAVEQSHADDAALTLLASILADGKTSILEKSFRIDEQVARNVSANNESAEVAGHFTIRVTAAPKVSLDDVELRVDNILKGIVANGVNADQLKRIKTRIESRNVRRLETVANKTSSLCVENMFTGNP